MQLYNTLLDTRLNRNQKDLEEQAVDFNFNDNGSINVFSSNILGQHMNMGSVHSGAAQESPNLGNTGQSDPTLTPTLTPNFVPAESENHEEHDDDDHHQDPQPETQSITHSQSRSSHTTTNSQFSHNSITSKNSNQEIILDNLSRISDLSNLLTRNDDAVSEYNMLIHPQIENIRNGPAGGSNYEEFASVSSKSSSSRSTVDDNGNDSSYDRAMRMQGMGDNSNNNNNNNRTQNPMFKSTVFDENNNQVYSSGSQEHLSGFKDCYE